jgi:hypothetical protein
MADIHRVNSRPWDVAGAPTRVAPSPAMREVTVTSPISCGAGTAMLQHSPGRRSIPSSSCRHMSQVFRTSVCSPMRLPGAWKETDTQLFRTSSGGTGGRS